MAYNEKYAADNEKQLICLRAYLTHSKQLITDKAK
jgi:hypothetical protein